MSASFAKSGLVSRAVFDTNILIDYLNGISAARREIALYETPMISVISWIEVMAGTTKANQAETRRFLERFERIELTSDIAELAVRLRKDHRCKLPDVLILASARHLSFTLVTRNTKDFDASLPGIRVPYTLQS
jgi:predicted nucleic acid-binding protein